MPNQKQLPHGQFLTVRNLPVTCDEQQLSDIIAERCGIILPLENIIINPSSNGQDTNGLISFQREYLAQLLTWALSEDRLEGHKLNFVTAKRGERLAVAAGK
jgi:hypothetical protein